MLADGALAHLQHQICRRCVTLLSIPDQTSQATGSWHNFYQLEGISSCRVDPARPQEAIVVIAQPHRRSHRLFRVEEKGPIGLRGRSPFRSPHTGAASARARGWPVTQLRWTSIRSQLRFNMSQPGTSSSGYRARFRGDSNKRTAERQPLLEEGEAQRQPSNSQLPLYSCVSNPHNHLPVYTNIHRIRRDITSVVEDYLSHAQLQDVRINITVVRPLVDKLYDLDDISVGEWDFVDTTIRYLFPQIGDPNQRGRPVSILPPCQPSSVPPRAVASE